MLLTKRDIGDKYEQHAAKYLRKQGCRIITENYRYRNGELDLIALDSSFVVFVEVRFRANENFGIAVETVTLAKQQKLIRTAQHFLQNNEKYSLFDARFDVIGITESTSLRKLKVDWIKAAFTT